MTVGRRWPSYLQLQDLSMRRRRLFKLASLTAAMLAIIAASASAQTNSTNNTNNSNNTNNNSGGGGLANAPAGVIISTEGLLRIRTVKDATGDLNRTRIAE